VLHKCDNPACVNPDHLFLGTRLENNLDRCAKGRTARNERQGASKLSVSDVKAVLTRTREGESRASIARSLGVSHQHISKIVLGIERKYVDRASL